MCRIVRDAEQRWSTPAAQCVDEVASTLESLALTACTETFARYPRLLAKSSEILIELIEDLKAEARKRMEELLCQQEMAVDLYTQNDHYLKENFDRAQSIIRRQLGLSLDLERLDTAENQELMALVRKAGYQQDVYKLIAPDHRDDAIWCMAGAFAYHKVAFKRFCDNVPRSLDQLLLREFVARCRNSLFDGLGVISTGKPSEASSSPKPPEYWLAEAPSIKRKREELDATVARRRKGIEQLSSVTVATSVPEA
ncbi:unnamed protein product [Polarella glacialis]|nr:unnamed protein product [Polarella glacialis]